jgi:hypothetical protein
LTQLPEQALEPELQQVAARASLRPLGQVLQQVLEPELRVVVEPQVLQPEPVR